MKIDRTSLGRNEQRMRQVMSRMPPGFVVPWLGLPNDRGRRTLLNLKVRISDGSGNFSIDHKYWDIHRDIWLKPVIFGLQHVEGLPIGIVCGSEFDTMLVWQECSNFADVVGGESLLHDPTLMRFLPRVRHWFIVIDVEDERRLVAEKWKGHPQATIIRMSEGDSLVKLHKEKYPGLKSWLLGQIRDYLAWPLNPTARRRARGSGTYG